MSKISDLIPDDKNYNLGNEAGNAMIEKSLRNLGAGRSILIDKNNRIIAGNKTVENAASIGLENLQIVESDGTKIIAVKRTDIDLDSKKGRELALADNATSKANIVWNHENLKDDWGDDELKGWGIELPVTQILPSEDEFCQDSRTLTDLVIGDLIEIGEHRLLVGDSTDEAHKKRLLGGIVPDAIVFDPPFELWDDFSEFMPLPQESNNLLVLYCYQTFGVAIYSAMRNGHKPKYEFIWDMIQSQFLPNRPLNRHRGLAVFGDDKHFDIENAIIADEVKRKKSRVSNPYGTTDYVPNPNGRHISSVERFGNANQSAQDGEQEKSYGKPIKWIGAILAGLRSRSVFDMFGGSGAFLVASEQIGCKYYGIEIDPVKCQNIINRMQLLKPGIKINIIRNL